jgi:hypothetical protein
MSIKLSINTNKKATLKLINHISSFLFEQDHGELYRNEKLKQILRDTNKALMENLQNN